MSKPGVAPNKIDLRHMQSFALAICGDEPKHVIMKEFNVSKLTVGRYLSYAYRKANGLPANKVEQLLNKKIVSYINELIDIGKYTRYSNDKNAKVSDIQAMLDDAILLMGKIKTAIKQLDSRL